MAKSSDDVGAWAAPIGVPKGVGGEKHAGERVASPVGLDLPVAKAGFEARLLCDWKVIPILPVRHSVEVPIQEFGVPFMEGSGRDTIEVDLERLGNPAIPAPDAGQQLCVTNPSVTSSNVSPSSFRSQKTGENLSSASRSRKWLNALGGTPEFSPQCD